MDTKGRTVTQRYTITAALPYANGPKHIGHLAGAYLPADVYARYLRLTGKDVIFVCGSDENGTAIPNQAMKEGSTPNAIIDKYHAFTRDCLYRLGISFDVYHRTSDPLHHQTARAFFTTLINKGALQKKTTKHFYDARAKTFLADRYVKGMCPRCGYDGAYGDQCEQCGVPLSPEDLILPRSTLTGDEPTRKTTTHWYLPLEEHEGWLRKWTAERTQHNTWKPNVVGQCNGWLDTGLRSRAMTRDLDWGVRVPRTRKKVMYVWFEAPIGYISATRALFQELATAKMKYATPQRDFGKVHKDDWKKYWQGDTKLVHFVGKDNIVFHCIIFPVMLHLAGEYITPHNVPANEFMNLEGEKMSTSKGWSLEIDEYMEYFPNRPDALRYALLSRLPETKDSEFTWKSYKNKNNGELVGILGNFVNRAMVLVHSHFGGKVPALGNPDESDKEIIRALQKCPTTIGDAIEAYRFKEAAALMMGAARMGNKYLTETEPWVAVKTDKPRAGTILYIALQIIANLAVWSAPFLPFTAEKIKKMLNMAYTPWNKTGLITMLKEGHRLKQTELLYQLLDNEIVQQQIQRLKDKQHKKITESLMQDLP